ncbi:flagella basal body P-ring formation protein FlgA [Paraburkholderia sp. MM6662-R1]
MFNTSAFNLMSPIRCRQFNAFAIAFASVVASAAAYASDAAVKFRAAADIDGNVVRFGDVADLSPVPVALQKQAAELVVARLSESATSVAVEPRRLAEAARRQMPALTPWLSMRDTQPAVVISGPVRAMSGSPSDARSAPPARCVELVRDLAKGDAITFDSVRGIACPQKLVMRGVHYDDKARVARAAQNLVPGDVITGIPSQRLAQVMRGERIVAVVRTGAVTVWRTGIALTDSASGRVTMIATGDHDILAIPATTSLSK